MHGSLVECVTHQPVAETRPPAAKGDGKRTEKQARPAARILHRPKPHRSRYIALLIKRHESERRQSAGAQLLAGLQVTVFPETLVKQSLAGAEMLQRLVPDHDQGGRP